MTQIAAIGSPFAILRTRLSSTNEIAGSQEPDDEKEYAMKFLIGHGRHYGFGQVHQQANWISVTP